MSKEIIGTVVKGWTVGPGVPVAFEHGTRTLHVCTKTCRECGVVMRHHMTRAAIEGRARNRGLEFARCADCRNGRRKPAVEPVAPAPAPIVADQPQDLASQMYRDNVALLRENAELKAALALAERAAVPNPVATPAQTTTPGADTAELEELRRFRLAVFKASRYVEHAPMYINAAGVKTYDLLGPEQVTNANLLAHVKEVGDTYEGMFQALGGYNNLKEGLNMAAYYKSYRSVAYNTLDDSVHERIDLKAQSEADAEYPM